MFISKANNSVVSMLYTLINQNYNKLLERH